MARNPVGEAPQARFFQYRNGFSLGGRDLGSFFWKGMATKIDPGAQPPDRPRLVLNGRFRGGHIVSRPPIIAVPASTAPNYEGAFVGAQPVIIPGTPNYPGTPTNSLLYQPTVITSHKSYSGLRLWWGAPIPVAGDAFPHEHGGTVGFLDTDWAPEFNEVGRVYQTVDYTPHVEKFYNFVYVGGYGSLRRIYQVTADPNVNPATLTESPASEVVATFPGLTTLALQLHEGKLYYLVADPTATVDAKVYAWDGFQVNLETTLTGIKSVPGASMAVYKSTLVVTVNGAGKLYVRAIDGTWSNATVAGFDSSPVFNSMAVLKDKLYIADGDQKIFSWDGTTVALEHSIAGSGTSPAKLNVCCAFNGRLYYAWRETLSLGTGADGNWPWLGMFDPDTVNAPYKWHDQYTSVTFWIPDGTSGRNFYRIGEPQALAAYRGRLFLSMKHKAACLGNEFTDVVYTDILTHSLENMPYAEYAYYSYGSNWYRANSTYLHINGVWEYNTPRGPVAFRTPAENVRGGTPAYSDSYRVFAYFKVF